MLKSALMRITQLMPAEVLEQGQDYFKQGSVLSVGLSDGLLKGRVKGNNSPIYNVHLDLKQWPMIASRCSCSKVNNCKHAVACLLALQVKARLDVVPVESFTDRTITDKAYPEQIINDDDLEWYSDVQDQGHDFFSYQLGITINGKNISIVPLVANLMNRFDMASLANLADDYSLEWSLGDGKKLKLLLGRIRPLLNLLMQYSIRGYENNAYLKLNRYELLFLHEAELAIAASASRWHGTELLHTKLKQLSQVNELTPIQVPSKLQAVLRDYQQQGLNWLQALRVNGLGGVLADDMGLGKTIQTLANLQFEKEQGRLKQASLIIAPTSLMGNWLQEAKRFTPDLKCLVFHGAGRHQINFHEYDLIISTYGLVQRDKKRFLDYLFYYLILDEAQFIKNSRTKTTQIVQQLKASHRVCLTGTPLENHLSELWSLFNFLMPGLLGDHKLFRQYFKNPIEKQDDAERRTILTRRVQPFMLRRSKNQVARELPNKTEIILTVELAGTQRDLYEAIRMSMEKKVRDAVSKHGLGKSQIVLLDALLKLRQVCCDPRLLSLPEAAMAHGNSAKLDALLTLLDSLIAEGRYVLVFSQFTSMLKLIEERLNAKGYAYLKLTGQTQHRHELVNRFQAGEVPIFLISLKAGGTGLNLTRADTVIHYDPWWNPAVQDQATSRSHRIGQENPVFVYQLLGFGTVEEVILTMQNKKRRLFDDLLSHGNSGNLVVTDDDIKQFFAPLALH